jgi:hypothetical protein
MRQSFIAGAVALAAVVGTALPASAVTFNLGTINEGTTQLPFDNTVTGSFSDSYLFTLSNTATFQRAAVTDSFSQISNFAIQLFNAVGSVPTSFVPGQVASSIPGFGAAETGPSPLAAGTYALVVTGTAGAPTLYSGNATFQVSPIPIPGALVMMGSALAGLAGFRALRARRRSGSVALA